MLKIFKKLAGDTIIFAIGNGASLLISFFMVPIYTKILSTTAFGVSDLINTTVNMLLPVLSVNIFAAVFEWALDKNDNQKEIFSNGLFVSSIGIVFASAVSIILLLLKVKYWWIAGFLLATSLLVNHLQNFARGIDKVRLFAASGVVTTFVNVIANIILMIIFHYGLNGFLLSQLIANVVCVFYLIFSGKMWDFWDRKSVSFLEIKKMFKFSIPLIPNSFAWWATNDANRLIILAFVGPSGNGLYAIANKIPSLLSTVFGLFQNAWQISAVNTAREDNVSQIYTTVFNTILSFCLVASAFIVSIIKIFMHFYVSSDFFPAWRYIPVLLLTAVFSNMSAFLGTTYLVKKKTNGLFTTTVLGTVINIVLSLILIPFMGLQGAAISGAVGFLIVSAVRLYQTSKWIEIKVNWWLMGVGVTGYGVLSALEYMEIDTIVWKISIILVMLIAILVYVLKIWKNPR